MAKAKRMRADHKERAKRLARGLRQLADEIDTVRTFKMLMAISDDVGQIANSLINIAQEGQE